MNSISFLIPTLNAQRTLEECLSHVHNQNFNKSQYEIIIADGGSTDTTREIAKKYNAVIIDNPLKTGEAGKMAALKAAKNEYVVFLDSDNILIDQDWISKMLTPFQDSQILATEPIRYDARKNDDPLTRYFAYLGMGDPTNLFLGNYDRWCAITNRWTSLRLEEETSDGYRKVKIYKGNTPTIGANGFVIKRELLTSLLIKDYLFDIDVLSLLMDKNDEKGTYCYIAKVDTGVVHLFTGSLKTFVRKQQRRIRDYVYYNSINMRAHSEAKKINPILKLLYPGGINLGGLLLYVASGVTIIPLLVQAAIGYVRKPDWVWLYHPLICELTLYVYITERIKSFFKKGIYDRSQWSQ